MILHLGAFLGGLFPSASLVAASKIACTPSPVNAEHSMYRFAPICCRTVSPCISIHEKVSCALVACQRTHLGSRDRSLAVLTQTLDDSRVIPQVRLASHEYDRHVSAVVPHFRDPLLLLAGTGPSVKVRGKRNWHDARRRCRASRDCRPRSRLRSRPCRGTRVGAGGRSPPARPCPRARARRAGRRFGCP